MPEPAFRYSPLVVGAYRGLLFIPLIFVFTGDIRTAFLLLGGLLALGLGLRPFLVRTGLHDWYCARVGAHQDRTNRSVGDKRATEIERRMRDDRYRRTRGKDPRLPKNW